MVFGYKKLKKIDRTATGWLGSDLHKCLMSFAFNFLTVSLLDRFKNLLYSGLSYLLLCGSEIRFACLQLACGHVDLHISSIWTETKTYSFAIRHSILWGSAAPFSAPNLATWQKARSSQRSTPGKSVSELLSCVKKSVSVEFSLLLPSSSINARHLG